MKKIFVVCIILFVSAGIVNAKIHGAAGTTSAQFLKIGIGARAIGMGQAFTAVADDATAPEWNPAGTSNMLYRQITAMHHIHFQDITQDYIGFICPTDTWSWGITARGLFYPDDIERRSGLGENIPEQPLTGYTDTFGGNDIAVAGNFSKTFLNTLNAGVNVKFIRQKIDVESGSSFAFDFGVLSIFPQVWQKPWKDMYWGAAVQNIGPGIKFVEKSYNLPLNLKTGLSYKPFDDKVIFAFDYNHSIDNYPYFSFGTEWKPVELLAFRAGYRYKVYGNDLGELSGVHAGIGFSFLKESSVDYAFMPQGDLGNTHRMSITLSFGRPKKIPYKKMYVPKEIPLQSLELEKAKIFAKPKKIALRKTYALVGAVFPAGTALKQLTINAEYPAGIPCPIKVEYSKEEDVDSKMVSQLPQGAVIYEIVSLVQNVDRLKRGTMTLTFEVPKEWLSSNGRSVGSVRMANSKGHTIIPRMIEDAETVYVYEALLENLTDYLILFGL